MGEGTQKTASTALQKVLLAIGALTGLLAAFTALIKAIAELSDSIKNLPGVTPIADLSWAVITVVTVVAFLIAALLIGYARRTRSRLAPGVELTLDADDPEHLAGRDEDVKLLTRHCADKTQVVLYGKSGTGKSALLRAGLVPKLRETGTLVPIYINVYGEDWERGPKYALSAALWDELGRSEWPSGENSSEAKAAPQQPGTEAPPKSLRSALGLTGRREPDTICERLAQFGESLGHLPLPLVIFDQFDEYQVRHRAKFVDDGSRAWRPVSAIVEMNSFWRKSISSSWTTTFTRFS